MSHNCLANEILSHTSLANQYYDIEASGNGRSNAFGHGRHHVPRPWPMQMQWPLAQAEAVATATANCGWEHYGILYTPWLLNKAPEVVRQKFELDKTISKNPKRKKKSGNHNIRRAQSHEQMQTFSKLFFIIFEW